MRRWLWVLALAATAAPAFGDEDIVDVLRRSQDSRLAAMQPAADSQRVQTLQNSFARLLQALQPGRSAELRVIRGPVLAETLHGHLIVVNEMLADMPESTRTFVLAHELGHVQLQHWLQMALVYQKWVPGTVTQAETDAVAAPLGREASALAHQQEYAADAYAAHALHALGEPTDDLMAIFRPLGATAGSATHPATRQRIASLRALEQR